jgi:hypothetical protein
MAASQLVFFLCWLAIALAGGGLIYVVWQRLYTKFSSRLSI